MEDAAKVAAFVNTLGHGSQPSNPNAVRMAYHCDRKHFMMDGVTAVLDWTLLTNGAVHQVSFIQPIAIMFILNVLFQLSNVTSFSTFTGSPDRTHREKCHASNIFLDNPPQKLRKSVRKIRS